MFKRHLQATDPHTHTEPLSTSTLQPHSHTQHTQSAMVSVRKRKMNRSGVAKVRTRRNNNKGKYNPKSNPVIAKHWDNDLTAKQNYKKLGLTFRLSAASGGEEKKVKIRTIDHNNMEESLFDTDAENDDDAENDEEFDKYDPANILEGTAQMKRDEEGNVIEIIYGTKKITKSTSNGSTKADAGNGESNGGNNNDDDEDDEDTAEAKQVISELEELANLPKKKEVHKLNELEVYRCEKLIAKYGTDYEKMKWDNKLNPFQLSPGQLRKLIAKYQEQLLV